MDFYKDMDPEVAVGFQALPVPMDETGIDWMPPNIPASETVATEDLTVPGPSGGPDVSVRVYRPVGAHEPLPGLFWMHGGGYIGLSVAHSDRTVIHIVEEVNCSTTGGVRAAHAG
jgi:acetyl esterase/lipase